MKVVEVGVAERHREGVPEDQAVADVQQRHAALTAQAAAYEAFLKDKGASPAAVEKSSGSGTAKK